VEEVTVAPGQHVPADQVLFRYDARAILHELKVARQQVRIVRSQMERARSQAFEDDKALSEIAVLTHRLAQEQARLELAEANAGQIEVKAQRPGTVLVDRPHEWRGKPVRVGERVMRIVEARNTRLRIWLAEADNVELDPEAPVRVFLNVAPDASLTAEVEHVGPTVTLSPANVPSFMAEAKWTGDHPPLRIGLKGTAILYGEEVSLLYWIGRRPLMAIRRFFGL